MVWKKEGVSALKKQVDNERVRASVWKVGRAVLAGKEEHRDKWGKEVCAM